MNADPRLPRLYVEGKNDKHVILALLKALGTELDCDRGPVIIEPKGSCSELLSAFAGACKAAQGFENPVGFVLDCDRIEDNRKQQLLERFRNMGCDLVGDDFTDEGIVKVVGGLKVGVWLMPNPIASSGKLEDFLKAMISPDDQVLPKAKAYVDEVASQIVPDSRFRDIDREKAEIHSWLAVQKEPGASYALAITSHLLNANSPIAIKFNRWFHRLYGIDSSCS